MTKKKDRYPLKKKLGQPYPYVLELNIDHKRSPKTPIKSKSLKRPDIFRVFISWMAIPVPLREPKTHTDFAKKFGVCIDTLTDWKKRPEFWPAVEEEWKRWGKEKTSNIIAKFYQKIMKYGFNADFKLWFQYFLNWKGADQIVNIQQSTLIQGQQKTVGNYLEELSPVKRERILRILDGIAHQRNK